MVLVSALADDFLAKITNGTVSNNSPGIKKLSYEEMKEIKGGYYGTLYECGTTSCYALANRTKSFNTMSYRENVEWNALTNGDLYLFVGFMAKNNWTISKSGHKYNYFTYDAINYDLRTGRIHKQ